MPLNKFEDYATRNFSWTAEDYGLNREPARALTEIARVTDVMQRIREYIAHADTCRSLAAKTKEPWRRAELLSLAAKWEFLAEERKRLLESQKRVQELAGIISRQAPPENSD